MNNRNNNNNNNSRNHISGNGNHDQSGNSNNRRSIIRSGAASALPLSMIALTILSSAQAPARADDKGQITVKVSGLKNGDGVVRVALFNTAESYEKSKQSEDKAGGAFKKTTATISDQKATCSFDALPYGEYAIKMFHDENNSGKFLTGMFGIPKVEYGFSNNVLGKLGPAPYDKAKFKLDRPISDDRDLSPQRNVSTGM